MIDFMSSLLSILSSPIFIEIIYIFSAIFKLFLITELIKTITTDNKNRPFLWLHVLLILFCALIEDASWILSALNLTRILTLDYKIVLFTIRIAWAANVVMYQILSLLLDSLSQQSYKIKKIQYVFISCSLLFVISFLSIAFFQFESSMRPFYEQLLFKSESIFTLLILMPYSVLCALRHVFNKKLPKILHTQLKTVTFFILLPHIIANIIQVFPFQFMISELTNNLFAVGITTILLNIMLYFCAKKIMRLRFLNSQDHVSSKNKISFIYNFKTILDLLSKVTAINEIKILTQQLFSKAFNIDQSKIQLIIRETDCQNYTNNKNKEPTDSIALASERFISFNLIKKEESEVFQYLKKIRIAIYDEINFDNFYNNNNAEKHVMNYLDEINSDIFLPIYEEENLIAYIIINKNARSNDFYSDIERDEMLIFSSYLSKIINLMQNRSLSELLKQRKEIIDELYIKHQEVNQYKESIRSFLKIKERQVGVIFYKNRRFSLANQSANELITINPNTQEGHQITRELKQLVSSVQIYKTVQKRYIRDEDGNKLIISGVPDIEEDSVFITVHHPEISDVIKQQLNEIKDPSQWDYLLYLETTESGKLINKLIPGSGEHLMQWKIDLLKLTLSKKAILLDVLKEDLLDTVELIHQISLRDVLHVLDLQLPVITNEIAVKLFSINPLLRSPSPEALLEILNKKGTLFIKNIHFLDLESQKNLAEFIRYGMFNVHKSDRKIQSDVRIICSSNKDLNALVNQGVFSKALFLELKKASFSMASLSTLPEKEIKTLIEGFTEQSIKYKLFNNLLTLSDKEKQKIIHKQRPESLKILKAQVNELLMSKSKKNEIYQESEVKDEFDLTDQELAHAARLGKHALKNDKVFLFLWEKFKNQSKIALFLGVNRSSVNRRCKKNNLL